MSIANNPTQAADIAADLLVRFLEELRDPAAPGAVRDNTGHILRVPLTDQSSATSSDRLTCRPCATSTA